MRLIYKIFILNLIVFFCSCLHKTHEISRQPLLQVEGNYLYLDEVQQAIPANVAKKDSTEIANNFIKKWIIETLMYENAKRNISNQEEIEKLVEEYRKSLTIHKYQQQLIQERLSRNIPEDEIKNFYEKYKEQLVAQESYIQGLLLIVPPTAPQIATVREWVKSDNQKALENIEKYSLRNAIEYLYFGNKWMPFSEILKKIPLQINDPVSFLASNSFVELSDSTKHYFLKISAFVPAGKTMPYEIAKEDITHILLHKKEADFISQFESELYNDAMKKKKIEFFKQTK
ncbi:MAG TPA: peptidylprolyl isomerase [Paludibacteraceae bacterium]|nr:peptidylprolyl isomerase [Paludibacteraceae bacterium]HOL00045.1 peptidylprolyl isomerase [Paludibacteraceae bacterium]HPO66941.1 peptidylprolyl isomerase [Paludibacteraceae bacterium]